MAEFFLNGEPVEFCGELTVREIISLGGRRCSVIPMQADKYVIEDLETGRRYLDADDAVPVSAGGRFLATHVGSTPVA